MTRNYLKRRPLQAHYKGRRFFRGTPQYLELKHMIDTEERFRRLCREALARYKNWKDDIAGERDPAERHYRHLEGTLLRQQAEDAVRLYGLIRRDVRRNVDQYIQRAANQL